MRLVKTWTHSDSVEDEEDEWEETGINDVLEGGDALMHRERVEDCWVGEGEIALERGYKKPALWAC